MSAQTDDFPTADDVHKAVDGRNDMIHAIYHYQCEQCKAVELIGLGCGVEGPRIGATERAYIASPFMVGCQRCRGLMAHELWGSDVHFPLRDAPPLGRYFKVPADGPNPEHFNSSCFSGEMGNADRPIYRGMA